MGRIGGAYGRVAGPSWDSNEADLDLSSMAPNFQHLRAFHAIATDGGVSRAARRLNVSQPTLSQQLKALEERHGITLFESRRVPLMLTAAGRELFAKTSKLFGIVSDIGDMLSANTRPDAGMLRLGADNPYYAATIVTLLHQLHPGTQVQVRMGNGREVMGWLADAHVDAALASEPTIHEQFNYEPLGCDQLMCAVNSDHPFTRLDVVPLRAFATETVLLREPTSKTRAFIEQALADAAVEPLNLLELQSRETIREAVALGLGIGVFYSRECPPDSRLAYRPVDTGGRDYQLRTYLVCNRQRGRDALMRVLYGIVRDIRESGPAVLPAAHLAAARFPSAAVALPLQPASAALV